MRNTTIVGNRASGTGGGVHSANDTNRKASLVDCIVAGNASGAAAKMQIYTFADNKLEPYADPLTFSAGSLSGSIAESAKFFITPEGTIVVVRINKESSLPEFCVLDENRQWTEWQTANDVKQYSGFDGAMAPDGTILCAYTSRDEAKVSRIESFTIGMEPDILPE